MLPLFAVTYGVAFENFDSAFAAPVWFQIAAVKSPD